MGRDNNTPVANTSNNHGNQQNINSAHTTPAPVPVVANPASLKAPTPVFQEQPVQIPIAKQSQQPQQQQNLLLSQIANPQMNSTQNPAPVVSQTNGPNKMGPQVVKVKLNKKNGGLGLSIVAARGTNQMDTGIYIKSVVPNGAAHDDARLSAGDQLLAVDENSLINVTQERAAELMCKSGPIVTLTVGKEAAYFHDLDALLNKSPLPQQNMLIQQPQQQQMPKPNLAAVSMPLLNKQNPPMPMNGNVNQHQLQPQQQQQQHQFGSMTLPRNHQQNQFNPSQQQQQQRTMSPIQPIHNQDNVTNSYRARSMSQEMLKSTEGPLPAGGQSIPINKQPYRPAINNSNGITSPQQQQQPQQIAHFRSLPNEQMRFGSERPAMHQHHMRQPMQSGSNLAQRQLPNEMGPRYGSERPSSHHFQQAPNFNQFSTSPTKQLNIQPKFRQSSLSEADEINYNQQQQHQQQQQHSQIGRAHV